MEYLVLDIETIVDERVWQPPPPPEPWLIDGRAHQPLIPEYVVDGKLHPPARDHFAPPHAWRPVVIGCVLFSRDVQTDELTVRRLGAIEAEGADPDERERSLLQRFADFQRDKAPTVITWNGRHFDLPVLLLRSLRYGIAHPWYYGNRECRYRYNEDGHCDLMDQMMDHGAADRLHLDGMAKLIGLPGKFGTIHGADVAAAHAAGRHAEIAAYCISDAVQTAFLWLRWLLLKGLVPIESYQHAAGRLLAACEANGQLTEFLGLVDRRVLLLEQAALKEAA